MTSETKQQAWQGVVAEVNAVSSFTRTVKEIKKKKEVFFSKTKIKVHNMKIGVRDHYGYGLSQRKAVLYTLQENNLICMSRMYKLVY